MRGCIQDLLPSNATDCLSNSDICKTCPEDNCNTRIKFQECYDCNSQTDPQCAKNPRMASTQLCKDYCSKCATGINKGFTRRKCVLQSTLHSNEFETCEVNNCNDVIYPKDRLKCYQCNGESDCDLKPTQKSFMPEPCEMYSAIDQCFTYAGPSKFFIRLNLKGFTFHEFFILADKKIYRGCSSDGKEPRLKCEMAITQKNGTCVKCPESGCNSQPKFSQAKLSCVECDDEEECVFGQDPAKATACEKEVAFGDVETCFIQSITGNIFISLPFSSRFHFISICLIAATFSIHQVQKR